MTVYVLDNNWLTFVFKSGHQERFARALDAMDCAIPEEVRDEANGWSDRRGQFGRWCQRTRLRVVGMSPDSPEGRLFRALHPNPGVLKDKGEHACIALISADPERTLVTHDKAASWLALRELPAHPHPVVSVFTFLRRLGETGGVLARDGGRHRIGRGAGPRSAGRGVADVVGCLVADHPVEPDEATRGRSPSGARGSRAQ